LWVGPLDDPELEPSLFAVELVTPAATDDQSLPPPSAVTDTPARPDDQVEAGDEEGGGAGGREEHGHRSVSAVRSVWASAARAARVIGNREGGGRSASVGRRCSARWNRRSASSSESCDRAGSGPAICHGFALM
jgi:hypothetical protein